LRSALLAPRHLIAIKKYWLALSEWRASDRPRGEGQFQRRNPEMSHSMIGADPGTHCKIVAVALAGAMTLTTVAIAARPGARDSAPAHAQSNAADLKAAKSLQPR
jgi:hypothetical protein